MIDFKQYLAELLLTAGQQGASDLHLSPGYYPVLRIDGRLVALTNKKILDRETLEGLVSNLLGDRKARFMSEKELNFSYEFNEKMRFRVNAYQTEGNMAATLRLVPDQIRTIEELNLPVILKIFTKLSQGLVLITGPSGHGRSSTLAALIDLINKERSEKIVTVEDPIEYFFAPEKSIVDQREIYKDTFSFTKALKSTLRQDINVIMIGELDSPDTISAAIEAADTGHLVFAAMHTNSASQAIEKMIDMFPLEQQGRIRNQLANTIAGVVSQRLVPRIKGGVIPAVEVMIATTAIRTQIRDNKIRQVDVIIDTGQEMGMTSLDRSLANLVRNKEITVERAEFYSLNRDKLTSLVG
jgi:twitching motility protein PilT